ncbi:unnamed protein product [Effrenium voratum]|nr:unnamed protein product [Effrenium voratum]
MWMPEPSDSPIFPPSHSPIREREKRDEVWNLGASLLSASSLFASMDSASHREDRESQAPAWLPLQWDLEGETGDVQQLLLAAAESLRKNQPEEAKVSYAKAFSKHLERPRMHLAFSAAFPLFFAALREGSEGGDKASCGRAQLVLCGDHSTDVVSCCRVLLEHVQSMSKYGEEPPASPPDGTSRLDFVHELCAQVGVSLDLVRVACVQWRRKGRTLKASSSAVATPESGGRSQDTPQTERRGDEFRSLILKGTERAGRFLRSMQAEMEELQGEAKARGH